MRRTRRLAGALLCCAIVAGAQLASGAAFAPAGAATGSGSFALAPVSPTNVAKPRTAFRYALNPGSRVTDSIQLFNFFDQPQSFELYASDGYTSSSGTFALRPHHASNKSIGAWTTMSADAVTVPAQSATTLTFALAVPRSAAPGDYAGGIVAVDVTTAAPSSSNGLSVDEGVATAVFLRVDGTIRSSVTVSPVQVQTSVPPWAPLSGRSDANLSVRVTNTGTAILEGALKVKVTDLFGRTVHQFAPYQIDTLIPGSTVTVIEPRWEQLPVAGIEQVTATFAATGVTRSTNAAFWVLPWGLIGASAAVLVLLLAAALVAVRRRRRRPSTSLADDDRDGLRELSRPVGRQLVGHGSRGVSD